jgi:myotubularin-related protein 3/4
MPCTGAVAHDVVDVDALPENPSLPSSYENYSDSKVVAQQQHQSLSEQNGITSPKVVIPSSQSTPRVHQSSNNIMQNGNSSLCNNGVNSSTIAGAIDILPGEELEKYDDVLVCSDLYFSTYRIILVMKNRQGLAVIPLTMLDNVEAKDNVYLLLNCKDGRVIRMKANTAEAALTLYKRFTQISTVKRDLRKLFAYNFCTQVQKANKPAWIRNGAGALSNLQATKNSLISEFKHLDFDEKSWRITDANVEFKLCKTYPQYLVVPKSVTDEELDKVHSGRFFSRFPVASWRCKSSGGVLLRSAQPTISWLGVANEYDIKYVEAISNANNVLTPIDENGEKKNNKLLILDMRSYTAAWANRAKGGGFEGGDTYANSEIDFMSLPNIHNVRYSFSQLRNVIHSPDDTNYFQNLNATQWFQYLGSLLKTAIRCIEAVYAGKTVLIHCSDGWDRTAQIISLCKVMADPYYRTFEGFKYLVQREWIDFGHKFADRNGALNEDPNERSPVFLQWLDCVHQLWHQNPKEFEFNQRYLMKMAQHSYSGMFGSFLFNSVFEAQQNGFVDGDANAETIPPTDGSTSAIQIQPISAFELFNIWDYLDIHNRQFLNLCYKSKSPNLKCNPNIPFMRLWTEVYRCSEFESLTNNIVDDSKDSVGTPTVATGNQIDPDRISNYSRSQSVSSLVSMNEVHGLSHTSGLHNAGVSGSPHFSNFPAYIYRCNQGISSLSNWKDFIDEDGLTKVPIELEDSVLPLVTQLMTEDRTHALASSQFQHHPPPKRLSSISSQHNNQHVEFNIGENHVKQSNGVTTYPSKRINGRNSEANSSPCADAENVPTRSGERISVK